MKFKLLIAAVVLALPAHAAVFKSAVTSDRAQGDVLLFFIPGKTAQAINPKTGQTGVLPAANALPARADDSSSAN